MTQNDHLKQVILGCKHGESKSFSQLVDMYASRCYRYFYRLTGDREISDDLLSELFVRLVEKINLYRGGSFECWLFKTASNIFYDYLRSKQRRKKVLEAGKRRFELKRTEMNRSESAGIDELQAQLGKLNADTRELIMLRFYAQLSFKELSELRGEPLGTVLSKVHRGLRKLRELMEG